MKKLKILYRLSDNGYLRTKFDFAPKDICLAITAERFKDADLYLFVDSTNLKSETAKFAEEYAGQYHFKGLEFYKGGSSAASFRHVAEFAFKYLINDEFQLYFLEDDYLHSANASVILQEGLKIADYVSLYDHLDKYIPAYRGGNPYIGEDGGETTKVFLTEHSHWKLTNSTTMTFATTMKTFKEDWPVWDSLTQGTYPRDFDIFMRLREQGRSLITPLPGVSTHCMPEWASPLVDWEKIVIKHMVSHDGVFV